MTSANVIYLLNQFNQALRDCRNIFLRAATTIQQQHPNEIDRTAADITINLDELHRGLLVKLYTTICGADHVWTDVEEKMAGVLVFHLWQQNLNPRQVREAVRKMVDHAAELDWTALVAPFRRYPQLRDQWPELEASVMQIGNLLAKCDGHPTSTELDELKQVQKSLISYLHAPRVRAQSTASEQPPHTPYQQAVAGDQSARGKANEAAAEGERPDGQTPESQAPGLSKLIEQLHALVGLDAVKDEVQTLVNFIKFQQRRAAAGLPQTKMSLHMVFTGNPGTGKTTVARLLGQIFGALGVLQQGHLVETDRSGLVAEYAGQTGPKTNQVIDQSLGGVLFIDEAYSLIADTRDDPYGHEAIQVLLKRMEDERERLVVILAGYPEPLDRMLGANPGLASRFSRRIDFPDYTPSELGQIFGGFCHQNHFTLQSSAQALLMSALDALYQSRDDRFGNGRLVRNIFEKAVRNMSNRVADQRELTRRLLTEFQTGDIEFEGIDSQSLFEENYQNRSIRVDCPQCKTHSLLPISTLGKRVRCKSCQTRFRADWCPIADPA